ncbi:sialate O-acetylesterase [Pedobacter sp. BS3]|uniref:sialate O-acetylesterase n=1 Tax=Pedobacter sp. BS3 TaxID=2567937 RepID=UPI0011EF356D|nr:sialate O-acetylesterase [Pedobacter sp. BS3]TZF83788.1 sialate O-acetylesterase [Pedobacter sp. BS3]
MKHIKYVIALIGTLFIVQTGFAQLRLPRFFSDHLVLQHDTITPFWGWARAGREVKIHAGWMKDTIKTVATGEAQWKINLPTAKPGGPYEITAVSDGDTLILRDVLLGEVWICSGQSNMQRNAGDKLQEMVDRLPTISNPNIRLLQIANIASAYPQSDVYNVWMPCDSSSAARFSAIGYFFAEKLQQELNIPVGIINASWGGTSAEVWTPQEVIAANKELSEKAKLQVTAPRKPNLPGRAWNSMIAPYAGYTIAGALWYQGENNVVSWDSYELLFSKMIAKWREEWGYNFPFYFAQIAPYTYKNKDLPKAALLREAQTNTMLHNQDVKMVVTSDLVTNVKDIHPTRKKEVALRLADIALAEHYKKINKNPYSPVYKSHQVKGDKIIVDFYFMDNQHLVIKGKNVNELYIAGEDRKFYPAKARIDKNKLIVFSDNVKKPVAVRFAFSETAETNLYSSNGLPVALFRTDDWNQFTTANH